MINCLGRAEGKAATSTEIESPVINLQKQIELILCKWLQHSVQMMEEHRSWEGESLLSQPGGVWQ